MRNLFLIFALSVSISAQVPFPGGGSGGGGGSVVIAATPYLSIGGNKFVAATLWPFTPFFTGSFLDANTCTLTAGTNGSELFSCSLNSTNAFYSKAATTSVEAEFASIISSNSISSTATSGIWLCDTTNSKLYILENEVTNGVVGNAQQFVQLSSWTLAACSGTPSAPTVLGSFPWIGDANGIVHLKLSISGGNLISQISFDGGQTYQQLDSRVVGTISKGGVAVRTASATTSVSTTFLSVAVQ